MTIDDDVARLLKKKRISSGGRTFKEAVNETLRNGLRCEEEHKTGTGKKFELKGRLLRAKLPFNFNKVQSLVESVEGEHDLK